MTSNVMPSHPILVLIVEDSQTGLVVVFLEAFDGDTNVEFSVDGAFFDAFEVVGLSGSGPLKIGSQIRIWCGTSSENWVKF